MTQNIFPFIYVLQFLSSVSCSFQCRGLPLPWLNLFLCILFFDAIINGVTFSDNPLLVYRNATNFCILCIVSQHFLFSDLNVFAPPPPPCLIAMARVSNTVLATVGILGLFLISEGMLSAVRCNVKCRLVVYGLYYIEVCFLYIQFVESFYHK